MDVMQEGRGVKGGRGSKRPGAPGAQRKGHRTLTWGVRSAGDPELERNCKCRTFICIVRAHFVPLQKYPLQPSMQNLAFLVLLATPEGTEQHQLP